MSASRPVDSAVRERGARLLGILHCEPAGGARLDRHRRDRVRDDVVQLARDPGALLQGGGLGLGGAVAVELRGLLHERLVELLAVAHELPEHERAADRDQAREDVGLHLVGVQVDRDRPRGEREADGADGPHAAPFELHARREGHEQDREERAAHVLRQVGPDVVREHEARPAEGCGDERRAAPQGDRDAVDHGEGDAEEDARAAQLGREQHLGEHLQPEHEAEQRVEPPRRERAQAVEDAAAGHATALCRARAGASSSGLTIAGSSARRTRVHTAVIARSAQRPTTRDARGGEGPVP